MNATVTSALDWLVAHRGWPAQWPENSLSGMRAVLEAGARFVELDVHLSRDGCPVVVHDEDLHRVSGTRQRVNRLDADALAQVVIGEATRFGDRFPEERLPRLTDMLQLLAEWPEVTVFVELKRASMRRFGRPALIESVLKALKGHANPCVMISFDHTAVEMARSRGAERIGWVFKPWNESARVEAARLKPDYLFVRQDRIPEGERPFWPGSWQWVVYGVNELRLALTLRQRGAHLIETDCLPELARAWMEAEGGERA